MRVYKIIKPIMLSFLTHHDQQDVIISEGMLGFDGSNIVYLAANGQRVPTITSNNAIDEFLNAGEIVIADSVEG